MKEKTAEELDGFYLTATDLLQQVIDNGYKSKEEILEELEEKLEDSD